MKNTFWYVLLIFTVVLLFSRCAKKGSPDGGPKDTIPPIIIKSTPENFTTNFEGTEIRVYFDEFIKLKDLQQNLIVSPPLKYQPIITPNTSAKVLKIKILDTLKENTTYVFNFGKSIVDNNEGNEYDYFKYVFSTGTYIDSLKLKGKVNDVQLPNVDKKTTVMLYEINETFKDSIIYLEKPTYIATTREKQPDFELSNLREGKYLLVALQEETSNYIFDPKKDKIAFADSLISLPADSLAMTLHLFKEEAGYKFSRASLVGKHKIAFGYEGNVDSLKITPLFDTPEDFEFRVIKDAKKDSINYWFKPAFDSETIDTLKFTVGYKNHLDTVDVRLKELYADSLVAKLDGKSTVIPRDSIHIGVSTPIESIDVSKITVMGKDSVFYEKTAFLDKKKNVLSIFFDKKDEFVYKLDVLPEAITDFFGNVNDSLTYTIRTKPLSDYGTINFKMENLKNFPVIVELVDNNQKVMASDYLEENRSVYFDYLEPNKYFLRIIYDTNNNKKWDTGSYLDKRQPEDIIYYPAQIEIRSNWSLNETFKL